MLRVTLACLVALSTVARDAALAGAARDAALAGDARDAARDAALAGAARGASLYRVVQFADLHFGEAENLWWGPAQDVNSTRVMRNVLAAEKPSGVDLVIFSGDQITGNNVLDNATAYIPLVVGETVAANIQFAWVYGNHDDAPLDPPSRASAGVRGAASRARRLSTTTRRQLLAAERAAFPALSLTCAPGLAPPAGPPCPESLAPAVSNYLVLLPNASAPRAVLAFLDSGGGSYEEALLPGVTAWLEAALAAVTAAHGALPVIVFVHIPAPEYATAFPGAPGACAGLADDGITPTVGPNALLDVLARAGGARMVNVGHDHGNAWCCEYAPAAASSTSRARSAPAREKSAPRSASGAALSPAAPADVISLCYGRHSGWGGYGDWDRGARVIELSLYNETARGGVGIFTYIRMEDGTTNQEAWL